jgi:hypothetical protein
MMTTQVHIYKYVQSRVAILQRHVSADPATIIIVSYNKSTINTQTVVQKCAIKQINQGKGKGHPRTGHESPDGK